MGETLVNPSDKTYVQITRDQFLIKEAEDLRPGDRVLFAKPFTTTTLEDVDPVLKKSPRYDKAKNLLHEVNSYGEYIPKLRTFIIRGLAKRGVVSPDNLEERILKERGDFTSSEYDRMQDYLHQMFDRSATGVSDTTTRKWLAGDVIAPSQWSNFRTLEKMVNSDFEQFKFADPDSESMYFNYRLYITIRQGVMRFLNKAKGVRFKEDWSEAENRISLKPEFAIVFEHFMKDINADYASARVVSSKKVDLPSQVIVQDQKVNRGIVINDSSIVFPEKKYVDVFGDMEIIENYITAMLEDYNFNIEEILVGDRSIYSRLTGAGRDLFAPYALPHILEFFGERLDAQSELRKKYTVTPLLSISGEFLFKYSQKLKDAVLSNEIDARFKWPEATSMRLAEAYFRTRTAIPHRVYDYIARMKETVLQKNKGKLHDGAFRKIWKDLETERESLNSKCGLAIGSEGDNMTTGLFFSQSQIFQPRHTGLGFSGREYVTWLSTDGPTFRQQYNVAKQSLLGNSFFITRQYALNTLRQYGLSDIVDLRKEDFLFERFERS
jgi:hypothetical protein